MSDPEETEEGGGGMVECPLCDGAGEDEDGECPGCDGAGEVDPGASDEEEGGGDGALPVVHFSGDENEDWLRKVSEEPAAEDDEPAAEDDEPAAEGEEPAAEDEEPAE